MFNTYYSFYSSSSFPIIMTTFIVLTIICFFLKIKKGVSAGIVAIGILILGYVVQRIFGHFTMGLDRIGYKLQRLMGDAYDILVAIVIFLIVIAILSAISSFSKKRNKL